MDKNRIKKLNLLERTSQSLLENEKYPVKARIFKIKQKK